jgi:hypothetical protein
MSSQIDFRTLPANVPVLCIPRVYPNISEGRIRKIFDDLDMGTLERVDIVSKTSEKGDKFNRVFVHFKKWNNSENSNIARERLLNGKEIKIIYDEPWFWKISAYRESERKPATHQHPSGGSRKPTIAFDSDEDKCSRPPASNERPRYQRRDDSRERPRQRQDERPRYDERSRRRDDSRERPRPRQDERPRYDERPRRRDDSRERPRPRQEKQKAPPQRKFIEPSTPPSSPTRERPQERVEEEEPDTKLINMPPIEYGDIKIPVRRHIFGKSMEPKNEKEEGEVQE